jgi:hypothetical protein
LFGLEVASTIERQANAFSNAHSDETSQQESIGIQVVRAAQFLLESMIIFRKRPGEIAWESRKILAQNETGLEGMSLGSQVSEQAAKTKHMMLASMVAHRRILLREPAEPNLSELIYWVLGGAVGSTHEPDELSALLFPRHRPVAQTDPPR